jgi:hypothetical protein
MTTRHMQIISAIGCLALASCGDALPTETDTEMVSASAAARGQYEVAAASGGANWDLGGFDLDGDGAEDPIGNVLAFNAVRYADGTVSGQMEYQQSALGDSFRFHGTVTCIGVYDGNRAKFGGRITRSDDETIPVGVFMWFTVVDNGQGGAPAPDRSSILGIGDNAANEAFCASNAPPNPRFSANITSGNITVHDGSAAQ